MHHKLEDIKVWNKAVQLSTEVYLLKLYGLVSQMRRSAVSIASNIAEGAGRNSHKEFIYF